MGYSAETEESIDKSDEDGRRLNSSATLTNRLAFSICNSRSLDLADIIAGTEAKLDDTVSCKLFVVKELLDDWFCLLRFELSWNGFGTVACLLSDLISFSGDGALSAVCVSTTIPLFDVRSLKGLGVVSSLLRRRFLVNLGGHGKLDPGTETRALESLALSIVRKWNGFDFVKSKSLSFEVECFGGEGGKGNLYEAEKVGKRNLVLQHTDFYAFPTVEIPLKHMWVSWNKIQKRRFWGEVEKDDKIK